MSVEQQAEGEAAAAAEEQLGEGAPGGVRPLDFSQPTKFTTELRRRISRAMGAFSESLGGWLAGELKAEVEVELGAVGQHTWAAAKSQLPADAIVVAVDEESIGRRMLLSIERPLVLQALEYLLGGRAGQTPPERHLSEIDWMLARGIFDAIVHQLGASWEELGGPALTRGEVDTEGDAGVLTPIGEPTLSVAFKITVDGQERGMTLLIPWAAVEPVTESIRAGRGEQASGDPRLAEALRRGVAGAQVLLRAEVGSVQMAIEQLLELAPGATLALREHAEEGVTLFAEDVSIGRGNTGRSGARRAVKLTATNEPAQHAETYAKLGRAELERARAHLHAAEASEERAILRSIFVRVWAELGRTHMPLGEALSLGEGAVLELDQRSEAPVELFANGLCVANGSLVVTGAGEWGVLLGELV